MKQHFSPLTFLQLQLLKLIIYNPSDISDTVISHVVVVFLLFFYFIFYFLLLLSFSLSLPHFDPDSEAKIVERKSDHLIAIFAVVTDKCHLFNFLFSHCVLTLEACHLKLRSLYFDIVHAFCILMDVQCTISHTVHEIREYIFIYEKILEMRGLKMLAVTGVMWCVCFLHVCVRVCVCVCVCVC